MSDPFSNFDNYELIITHNDGEFIENWDCIKASKFLCEEIARKDITIVSSQKSVKRKATLIKPKGNIKMLYKANQESKIVKQKTKVVIETKKVFTKKVEPSSNKKL